MPRPETRSNPSSSVSELAALAKLFEEHRERLLAMARRRIDPALAVRVDAEDVLGEAFLRAGARWSNTARRRCPTLPGSMGSCSTA